MQNENKTKEELISELAELRGKLQKLEKTIDRQKRMENDLKMSEEKYRNILESIEDGYYEVDIAGNFKFFNDSMYQILGYPKEELIELNNRRYMSDETAKRVYETFNKVYRTKKPTKAFDWELIRKDGKKVSVETSVTPIIDSSKKVIGFRGIARNITERKEAEEALRQSEAKYRDLIENAADLIFMVDTEGNLLEVNETILRESGYSLEELLSMNFIDFLFPDDISIAKEVYEKGMAGNLLEFEMRTKRRDGSFEWYSFTIRPIFDSEGSIISAHGIGRNITERKRAEDEVLYLKRFNENIINHMIDPVDIVDEDLKIIFQNNPSIEKYGDGTGEKCYEFYHNIEAPCNYCTAISSIKEKKTFKREVQLEDGSYLEVYSSPLLMPDGSYCSLEIIRDITERKKAEVAIKDSEEKYRTLFENAKEAILVLQDGVIKFFNPKALEISGFSGKEFLSRSFVDLIHPDDLEKVMVRHQRILDGKDLLEPNIYRVFQKGGNFRWVEGTGVFIEWEGRPASLSFFSDITEKKEAEEALIESERKFRNLFETSQDVIFFSTADGKIVDINLPGEALFGYAIDEFKELDLNIFYQNTQDLIDLLRVIREKGSVKDYELLLKKKDGSLIDCLLTATVWKDDRGKILGYQGIIRDVTEKKKFEKQLVQAQKMEAIGSLAGGIAHNFNNILVGIMGYSEYLSSKKGEDDPDYKALKTINDGTIRASELTRQLLNVARREEHKRSTVNLNDIVRKGLPLIAGTFDKSIEIKTYLPDDLLMIEGDVGQMEQCFLNICINARDAMPKGGRLIIETFNQKLDNHFVKTHVSAIEGDYVVLSVTDTGKGIPTEIRERIFEPFFTTKEDKGGTGMGLSTVYGILNNHGGLVTVYSEEGKGSTFKLYLPMVESAIEEVTPVVKRIELAGDETILIIDDEPIVKEMWGDYLKDMGYRAIFAEDGQEGIDIFSQRKDEIDLIILDLVMPKLGGKEAFFRLREIDPDVRVLFTSGYSENGQAYEILGLDAEGFMQKPFPLREFAEKIREILDRKKN